MYKVRVGLMPSAEKFDAVAGGVVWRGMDSRTKDTAPLRL